MIDPKLWPIHQHHILYGEVTMMYIKDGEPMRAFMDSVGTVSLIPLSVLQEEYK